MKNVLFVIQCFFGLGLSILTEQEYAQIPQIYDMDDFPTCLKENKIVCRVHFDIVMPNGTSNNAWNIIQKSRYGSVQYRKDKLKRIRCLSKSFVGKEDDIAKYLLTNENQLLRNYSLQANIEELYCRNYQDIKLTTFDYAVLFGTIGLIGITLVATIVDVWLDVTRVSGEETAVKYVQYFSMISNWKTLTRPSTNIDRQKLKGMQGVRVLGTIYVICGHTVLTILIYFVKNTRFIEEFGEIAIIGIVIGMYIVQISFLISGWVLANSIYKYVAKTGRLTVKDVIMFSVYRYLRLFPLMIILQCWEWSNLIYIKGGLPFDFMEMHRNACRNHWWRSIFLINNFSRGSDHCNPALWSLANDFQMYFISLCLFYVIFKFKKSRMLFIYMSGVFCGIHGYEMVDLDAVQIFKADEFYVMYSSLYVNFGSYAIGVIFGSFYYEYKNLKIESNVYSVLWAAIIGPFAKPSISLCLAIGILGMTFGLGACLEENKIVCRVHFEIVMPNGTSNNAWNIIQKSRYGSFQYRKDKLKRFRCLSKSFVGKEDDIAKSLLTNENKLLRNYSLQANIEELYCRNYQGIKLTTFDYAVFYGTIAIKYVQYFSMISNWKILTRPSANIDRQKLKAMQGIRVLGTVYVVCGHTVLAILFYFVKNTRFIEEFRDVAITGIVIGMYVVQISFLISGWLLANSIYKYVAKTERLTVKDVITFSVYRYLSNLLYIKGGLPFDFMEMQHHACRNHWWRSIFLINNFSKGSDHCNPVLWSLANDFQMYLISLCLFYIIFKYKKSLMLFIYMSGIFCGIHGYEMVDLDGIQIFKADEFYVMYSSLYVNFGSYAIGVIFGSFHYEYRNLKIESNVYSVLWAAIIGPFAKPTISFCLAIGILGMTFGLGGFIRRISECNFIQLIANWQYSVYIEQEYAQIPQIYDMDDFATCLKENKIKSRQESIQYRRDKLKRIRCLSNSFLGKEGDIAKSLLANENELLRNYSLLANIEELQCRSYQDTKLTSFDYAVLFGTIGLIVIVLVVTAIRCVQYFSMVSNWKILTRPSTDIDRHKLKGMQGMRVLSTIYVIIGHTVFTVLIGFVKNPRFFEQFGDIATVAIVIGMYIVQISFLISGWLLANSIYKYVAKTGRLTVKDIIMFSVYRYLRLCPAMIILQCWEWSNFLYIQGGLPYGFMEMQRTACTNHWWRSIFLINNFSKGSDHCNAALWSVADDFQMYFISLCLFYIIFKYKKNLMLFIYMSGIFCGIHGYEMNKRGYQHIVAFSGQIDLDAVQIFKTDEFYVMYASLYVNFASYAIGVIFGSFYYEYKNLKIESNVYSVLWAAIIGPFAKPTISLCLAIGILGMTFGLGGFIRRIAECNFIQLIANWQYSVLIGICDVIGSYLFGLLIYLVIEKPFTNIVNSVMFPPATKEVKVKQDTEK
ncbi:unnamed protein product [Callosobruchus maculatus]|uniref:Acyltransferase 3 domain-containing protein n=1 Tax=Callosobruchus maculatus TaxID=64391 RepID=A0A653BG30_CALMS|nr:unnamed protein product [Callosobruchus maculatus]